VDLFSASSRTRLRCATAFRNGVFIATQLNSTQLNSGLLMNVVTQLTQFVGRDVIHKNTTDLAIRCLTGSVEFS